MKSGLFNGGKNEIWRQKAFLPAALASLVLLTAAGATGCNTAPYPSQKEESFTAEVEEETAPEIRSAVLQESQIPDSVPWASVQPAEYGVIRDAIRLDVRGYSAAGPLVAGKILLTQFGEPVALSDEETAFFSGGQLQNLQRPRYQIVSIMNCITGTTQSVCAILPFGSVQFASSLDGVHAYLWYTKYPYDVWPPPDAPPPEEDPEIQEQYYQRLWSGLSHTVIQVNMRTGHIKEYTVTGTAYDLKVTPLGDESLLLRYTVFGDADSFTASDTAGTERNLTEEDYIDVLNLETGAISNFYSSDNLTPVKTDGFLEIQLVSVSENRAYFQTRREKNGGIVFGFQVYDHQMNFIDGQEISTIPSEKGVSPSMQMRIALGNIYCRISNSNSENSQSQYYQYVPVVGGYQAAEYDLPLTEAESFITVNPRNAARLNWRISQDVFSGGQTGAYLENGLTVAAGTPCIVLEDGLGSVYRYPVLLDDFPIWAPSSTNESGKFRFMTDYAGDYVLYGNRNQLSSENFFPDTLYYIPSSEILRACQELDSEENQESSQEEEESSVSPPHKMEE